MADPQDVILCPDADRFPMSANERALAASAGLELHELPGRDLDRFRWLGGRVVGSLAWGGRYGADFFEALPRLRVLARCGAGYDNIDLESALLHQVVVTYVPGASDEEVSEHTIALLLGCLRKLTLSDRSIRAGSWPSSVDLAPMRRLSGSRLGLVGLGHIARAVAAKARGLGVVVSAVDPFVDSNVFQENAVRRELDLASLLSSVDAVSLHVPLGEARLAMMGAREFDLMRPGAVFINTARGRLVDEGALVEALRSGAIAAAGLDVFEEEPLPEGHRLLGAPNLILTPHSAAFSVEALGALRHRALSDVLAVLHGQEPSNPISSTGER